jgi:hypothetical protein
MVLVPQTLEANLSGDLPRISGLTSPQTTQKRVRQLKTEPLTLDGMLEWASFSGTVMRLQPGMAPCLFALKGWPEGFAGAARGMFIPHDFLSTSDVEISSDGVTYGQAAQIIHQGAPCPGFFYSRNPHFCS